MTLKQLFKGAVEELRRRGLSFTVAGGFACDLYRDAPRLTMDVDLGILCDSEAEETAVAVLECLGLRVGLVREADLAGGPPFAIQARNTRPVIAVGRPDGNLIGPGVDILLPSLPWMLDAVHRAQSNPVDFGFGPVPTLTIEDVIIAKLYALRAVPLRAKDLDDLQSIFAIRHEADRAYLAGQCRRFGLVIPRTAKPLLPKELIDII